MKKLFLIFILIGIVFLVKPVNAISPLHVDGRWIKNETGHIVILRGGWVPIFEDTCNARAALEGEIWNSHLSTTTWRPDAVNTLLDAAKSWGFNSLASFMWIDWWIYNERTELGVPRGTIVTDRPYQQNIKEFLELAEAKGIYVQIRPYGTEAGYGGVGEGRVNFPFPVPGESYTHAGHILADVDDFADFWYDVALKLADNPNVIFNLYDEAVLNNYDPWWDANVKAITKIREAEASVGGYTHLIQIHRAFSAGLQWIPTWLDYANARGLDLTNVIYSGHVYRDQGWGSEDTYGIQPYTYDYATQKAVLEYDAGDSRIPEAQRPYGRAYKKTIDEQNVAVVATVGANSGWEDDQEYTAYQNTLSILNEWQIGYWNYVWWRTGMIWSIVNDEPVVSSPNRVGQTLIDAIASGSSVTTTTTPGTTTTTTPSTTSTTTTTTTIPTGQVSISGQLRNATDTIDASVVVYNERTSQINTSQTTTNGDYSLGVWPDVYDLQYNILNFFIPNFWIKLISLSMTSNLQGVVNYVTGYTSENKVSFSVDITTDQEIQVYSEEEPEAVKVNGTDMTKVSSQPVSVNEWFYNSSNNRLYMITSPVLPTTTTTTVMTTTTTMPATTTTIPGATTTSTTTIPGTYKTFGKTDVGNDEYSHGVDNIIGSRFQLTETGTVSKVTANIASWVTILVKAAIYDDDNGAVGNLKASSNEISVGTSFEWYNFTLSTSLNPGYYWLVLWSGGNIRYMYDSATANQLVLKNLAYGSSWPDPFGSSEYTSQNMSIFATYTPS